MQDSVTTWVITVLSMLVCSGVDGSLTLEPTQARLRIALGFLFSAFSSQIESKVVDKMRKVFAPV